MSFWDDLTRSIGQIGQSVGSFFGGGNQKKKPDNQGTQNNFGTVSAPITSASFSQPQIRTQRPQNAFQGFSADLRLPGSTPNNRTSVPQKSPQEQEIDALTQKNLAAAKAHVNQGQGLWGGITNFFTHNNDKIAEQSARNQAVRQYQDNHGYNNDPVVGKYIGNTVDLGNRASAGIKTQNDTLDNIIKNSSWVPGATEGAAGAAGLYHLLGNKSLENEANSNYSKAALGMSSQEIAKLPPDQQDRLRKLQAGLTVASPVMDALNIASAGEAGLALKGLRTVAVQGGKGAAIRAGVQGAKNIGRNAAIGAVAAPVISAPVQNYVSGGNPFDFSHYDPSNIPRESLQAALWSILLPGASKKPAAEDINNAKTIVVQDAGEAARAAAEDANRTKIQVKQPKDIPVIDTSPEPTGIPVTNKTPTGKPIVEVGGDTPGVNKVNLPTPDEIAAQKFANQPKSNPNHGIDGVISDNTKIITGKDKANAQLVLDDYLKTGKITDEQHQQLTSELAKIRAQDEPAPKGQKIDVKEVKSIPVTDQTTVPTNLPETPGTVRATEATAPNNAKTQAVASTPVVAGHPALPTEVQKVLDNPKQFNKRQVAAARNQAKLAKRYAKAQEDAAVAMDRVQASLPAGKSVNNGDRGFVQTGELSQGRHGVVQNVHSATEAAQGQHDTANLSAADVLSQADQEKINNSSVTEQTVRNLKAKIEDPSIPKNTPEGKLLVKEYHDSLTRHAQALAIADKVVRRSATGEQIANKFKNKLILLADNPGKISDADMASIDRVEGDFANARDTADSLAEQFKATGSEEDYNAWKDAFAKQQSADRQSRAVEYTVTKRVLKGDSNPNALKVIQQAEKDTGAYSMDFIDSNMLSGTGTMVRNYVNTLFPRVENKLFGKVSSLATRKLAPIGGSSREGAKLGAEVGKVSFKADSAARKEAGVGLIRRTVTAGNTLGEKNIQATAYARGFDYYKQSLAKDGYTGKELMNRAKFQALTDPEGVIKGDGGYEAQALQANALSSLTHSKKIENWLSDTVQKKLVDAGFGYKGQMVGRGAAKAVTRIGVGFPTVIARSLLEGAKRASVGIPEALWSTAKYMKTGNKEAFAGELSTAIQHAGSGGALMTIGAALGNMGVISGAYPSDPAERDRWKSEGKEANSVKIGGQWFGIPGYLGGFALPLMAGAALSNGNIRDEASFQNIWQDALAASPVDNIQSTLDILTGKASDAKIKNAVTSLVRSVTPAGAFIAELAKLTDPTKNDTTTKDAITNILDSIAGGIPGINNAVNKIPATDANGNVINNPNPVATILGAQGAEQSQGTKDVQQAQDVANSTYKQLGDDGILQNKTLMGFVDKKIQAQIARGEDLTPEQVKSVQKSVTKGISPTEDSNWRESGDYATDKAVLQTKLRMLDSDPTTKPSEKEKYQIQIKRDEVLQKNNIPYDALHAYEHTTLSEWRAMGNPKNDAYDPNAYQKLWAIDEMFTKVGGSYNSGDPTQQKFSAKKPGSGRGGSRSFNADFGKLKAGVGAPTVQQYGSIDQKSGSIPVIQVQRPNIVHKISSGGGI